MRTIQLYATGSSTANAVAQVTIPSASRIKGIAVNLEFGSTTDSAEVRCELSKIPTSQIAVNGAIDPFLEVGFRGNFVTSGLAQNGINQFFPVDIECRQGEIIYLHVTIAGTITYKFNAIMHYA